MEGVSGRGLPKGPRRWPSRPILFALPAILLAALMLVAVGCGSSTTTPSPAKTSEPATTTPKAFANPNLLVETDSLVQKLSDTSVRIVDVRTPDEYKAGHIKGAVSIPVDDTFLPAGPKAMAGSPEQIAELFGSKGIGNDAKVIVYDSGKDTKASRVFWTLEYFGHKQVSVLNGGFKKWQKEGKEVSTAVPSVTAIKLTVKAEPARLDTMSDMRTAIGKAGVAIVDARSPEEYRGEDVRTKRGGHVPGAVNIDWRTLFTPDDTLKPAAELAKMYEEKGVTKDKEVHAY